MKKTENPMGVKPVFPLLLSMSFPPMVSMLIQSLYNIVDGIFVAKISEDALAAVSLAFPLQNLVLALSVGFGVGLNAAVAKNLGAQNHEEVDKAAAHGVVLTFLHSALFLLVGLFLVRPFLSLFTGNAGVLEMGVQYGTVVISLSFGCFFHLVVEKLFQALGNMVLPMVMQVVGALVNIILDPILIFGLFGMPQLGVLGAAVATVAGQLVACAVSVFLFLRHSGGIRIRLKGFRFDPRMLKSLYSVAIPSSLMISLPSIMVAVLNGILAAVSQTAVALFGVYYKLQSFVYMPANGVVQGLRPIVSYNYGAGKHDRVHKTLEAALITDGLIMALGTVLFLALPGPILSLFSAGPAMLELGVPALRILSLGFLLSTVGVVYSGAFEALGKGLHSLFVTLLRQFAVTIPLSLLLIGTLGLTGVWLTFPVAEALASLAALLLYRRAQRRL